MDRNLRTTINAILASCLLALVVPLSAAASDSWLLKAADWSRPRSGEAVLAMKPVAQAVRSWQSAGQGARLLLVHAGGEEGSLWGAELRDWLIALGLPPDAIVLAPGGQPADRLEIRLEAAPGGT